MMFFFLTMHFLSKPFLRHFGYAAFSHLESTVDEFDDISPQRFQGPKGVGKMCFIPRVHVVTQEGLLFFSLQNGIIYGNYPDSNWGQRIERMLGREILSKLPLIVFFLCWIYKDSCIS